jgi:hypothetical protein
MKNNINFYPHYTNSHEHWKFELLRAKYDWQGEGIFWALNNLIGQSDNTVLDLNNKSKKASISGKFKMSLDEFELYLNYLATDCELIIYRDGMVTTDIVSNVMNEVSEKRRKERERIESWRKQKQSNEHVTRNNDNVRAIKESKVKKEKKESIKGFTPPSENDVILYFRQNGFPDNIGTKAFKYYSEADWKDSKGNKVKNWKQKMQGVWFKEENKSQNQKGQKANGANNCIL